MSAISYSRHRFPPVVIQHAVWLYLRFSLSYRDVEELLAERGLDLSYESVRSWVLKFGPAIARGLRRCRPRPSDRWHLDEMVVRIAGKHVYLWTLSDANAALALLQASIELDDIPSISEATRAAVLTYNRDDCRSASDLHSWLEALHKQLVEGGTAVPRPLPG